MRPISIGDWIQVLTSAAVLVGLGLVIYELRQARELAHADVLSQQFAMGVQLDSTMLGEDLAATLAKACDGNTEISTRDALILRNYHWGVYDKFNFIRETNSVGGLETGWVSFARYCLETIFETEQGRIWWELEKSAMDEEVVSLGDEVLATLGSPSCADEMRKYAN